MELIASFVDSQTSAFDQQAEIFGGNTSLIIAAPQNLRLYIRFPVSKMSGTETSRYRRSPIQTATSFDIA